VAALATAARAGNRDAVVGGHQGAMRMFFVGGQ
jgi:hypothetical protein